MASSKLLILITLVAVFIGFLFVLLLKFIDSQFARLEALNKEINDKIDNLKDKINNS